MNQEDNQDEINLGPVFNAIGRFFRRFFNGIGHIIRLIIRRWFNIGVFVIIALIGGTAYYFLRKPVYSADMLVQSNILPNEYCASLIAVLHKMTEEKDSVGLAHELSLDMATVRQIKEIDFRNYSLYKSHRDSVNHTGPFIVEAEVYSNKVLTDLQNALQGYLEHNPYSMQRKKVEKQKLESLIANTKTQINKIDSLKRTVDKSIIPQSEGKGIIFGQPLNPVTIYKEGLDLYSNQVDMEGQMTLLRNIDVVYGFTAFRKPASPKLWIDLLVTGIIGLIIGLIFVSRQEMTQGKGD